MYVNTYEADSNIYLAEFKYFYFNTRYHDDSVLNAKYTSSKY